MHCQGPRNKSKPENKVVDLDSKKNFGKPWAKYEEIKKSSRNPININTPISWVLPLPSNNHP